MILMKKNVIYSKTLFTEQQRFTQWWLWLILAGAFIWSFTEILLQIQQQEVVTNNDIWGLVIIGISFVLIFGLLLLLKLQTEITTEGISVRFFPFLRLKSFAWNEFDQVYIRQYKPLIEYGGWGIRGVRKNRAFNVSGKFGIQLIMKNGNKLLIGTKKPSEIEMVLKKLSLENHSLYKERN